MSRSKRVSSLTKTKSVEKAVVDLDADADLRWLKSVDAASTWAPESSVPGYKQPAASIRTSLSGLKELIAGRGETCQPYVGRGAQGSRTSLVYSSRHNPLFQQHRSFSHTGYGSLPGTNIAKFNSSPGQALLDINSGSTAAGAAYEADRSNLLRLSTQLQSVAEQLRNSGAAVEQLSFDKQSLRQRVSQTTASEGRVSTSLKQHEQSQLQQVLAAKQRTVEETSDSPALPWPTITARCEEASTAAAQGLNLNERKLVKFLKKLQKENDRLNGHVQQLLESQAKLMQQVQTTSPNAAKSSQQQQQHRCGSPQHQQHSVANVTANRSSWPAGLYAADYESQLQMQLQELQQELDSVDVEQHPSAADAGNGAVAVGLYDTIGLNKEWLATRSRSPSQNHQQKNLQQQAVIEDQAATISSLKKVIAELELQTSVLRNQTSRQDISTQALTDCQAQLAAKQRAFVELHQQHKELQELSQAAIRDAMRATQAAEAERDEAKQKLQDEQLKNHAGEIESLKADNDALAGLVERLRQERQDLLQRLLEANEQITDLHDELGPALYRGSPTRRGSSFARSSKVLQLAEASSPSRSGVGLQLSSVVGELSSRTRELRLARDTANKEVQESQEAYRELQQQLAELQIKHQLLKEEHAQLLTRQLDVTGDRGSLRQQYLATEELYLAAKKQISELQNELLVLKASQAARPSSARSSSRATTPRASSPDSSGQQQQLLQQQQMILSLAADNARLAVALAELMQEQDDLTGQLLNSHRSSFSQTAAAGAAASVGGDSLEQQRLQLLLSQLVVLRDQIAAAASLPELQRARIDEQQQRLTQLTSDLALLQQQHKQLQQDYTTQAQAAVVAAVKAAREPWSAHVTQVLEENYKLKLEVNDHAEHMRRLAADNEALQAAAVDRMVVDQLNAKNKVLLQEITRLLSESSALRQQLSEAQQLYQPQHQQPALPPTSTGITASPITSSHTSRQASTSQIAADLNVTRSPTLSRVASLQEQHTAFSASAAAVAAASYDAHSPFSSATAAAASPVATGRLSGSASPAAQRSRSMTEGSLKVCWSAQLANDAAVADIGNRCRSTSPLSSPISRSNSQHSQHQQLQQAALQHAAAAADDIFAAPAINSMSAALAGSGVGEAEGLESRPWSGMQPTPRSRVLSPAAAVAPIALQVPPAVSGDNGLQPTPYSKQSSSLGAAPAAIPVKDSYAAAPSPSSSNRAAVIAAALDRQRSKSSISVTAESSGLASQQQQQMVNIADASNNSSSSFASDKTIAAVQAAAMHRAKSEVRRSAVPATAAAEMSRISSSADGSAGAHSQDRAALIAAVLQRQKAKQSIAGEKSDLMNGTSSIAFSATNSRGGSITGGLVSESSASSLQQQLSPNSALASAVAAAAAGKDRASIVAAVLAQRQQRQQGAPGSSIANNTAVEPPAAAGAGVAGSRLSTTADRASLVAAVLAKHNLGK